MRLRVTNAASGSKAVCRYERIRSRATTATTTPPTLPTPPPTLPTTTVSSTHSDHPYPSFLPLSIYRHPSPHSLHRSLVFSLKKKRKTFTCKLKRICSLLHSAPALFSNPFQTRGMSPGAQWAEDRGRHAQDERSALSWLRTTARCTDRLSLRHLGLTRHRVDTAPARTRHTWHATSPNSFIHSPYERRRPLARPPMISIPVRAHVILPLAMRLGNIPRKNLSVCVCVYRI